MDTGRLVIVIGSVICLIASTKISNEIKNNLYKPDGLSDWLAMLVCCIGIAVSLFAFIVFFTMSFGLIDMEEKTSLITLAIRGIRAKNEDGNFPIMVGIVVAGITSAYEFISIASSRKIKRRKKFPNENNDK